MKPTKTAWTKRTMAKKKPRKYTTKRAYDSKSPLGKLMKLKYRINDNAKVEGGWSINMELDKEWVMEEITNLRNDGWLSATKMKVANEMWNKYGN